MKLITTLQTGKQYSVRDLAGMLEISRRTLFRDLNLLKHAGVPVSYDNESRRYRIAKSFFLPPVNFTHEEALGLLVLTRKYSTRAALPNFKAIASAMMKIESSLPSEIREYCGNLLENIECRFSPMADVSRASGIFERLLQSTRTQEMLKIKYDSYYEKQEIQTRINPYRLVFITRAWYVLGYSGMHREIRTFKVERILEAIPTGRQFRPDPKFDLNTYFGNAWQMIRGDRRYHVRIRFSPKVAGNVEEVLWHATQQTKRLDDGSLLYEADVDGVCEISWWVLGYGKEAMVEGPAALKKIIRTHIDSMAEMYGIS
ncbi:MAG: WYL domain-containing transcriptional regulator [Planctomycetota bacterium]|nr:MAG: WYL domain-containing transcriptional regulator [Planctomycetota bacterium]